MKSKNLPKVEAEQYEPNLDAQDEDVLSGGNNRLTYILAGLIVALVLGFVMLPKGQGSALASVTPSFMLDDASVTATVPAAADSLAAGLASSADNADGEEENDSKSARRVAVAKVVNERSADVAAGSAAAVVATPAAAEPVAPPAPAAEPVAAAPANATLTGKIEDENGHPLVGATVLLKGSSKGTSTDANGNYSLEVPAGGDNTLIYGYGGYDDEVVHARNSQPVNVTLTPRAKTSKRRR